MAAAISGDEFAKVFDLPQEEFPDHVLSSGLEERLNPCHVPTAPVSRPVRWKVDGLLVLGRWAEAAVAGVAR